MSISEKANDLLNKFGSAQFDFMVWNTPDNLVARDKARQEISDYIAELEAEVTKGHELQDSYCDRIAELKAAQRWIPVSERLPDIEDGDSKDYDVVLTYPFRRDVIVATWSYDALDKTHRRRWFDCSSDEWGSDDITEYVTHWRERPTPPEVQE